MKRKGKWLILENDNQEVLSINHISSVEDDGGGESKIRTNNDQYYIVKDSPEEILKIIRRKDGSKRLVIRCFEWYNEL